jgi:hypothetical protein
MSLPAHTRSQPYHSWIVRALLALLALLLTALATSGARLV